MNEPRVHDESVGGKAGRLTNGVGDEESGGGRRDAHPGECSRAAFAHNAPHPRLTARSSCSFQAIIRGIQVRKHNLRCRDEFLTMLREVEGEEAARRLRWGAHLSWPRLGRHPLMASGRHRTMELSLDATQGDAEDERVDCGPSDCNEDEQDVAQQLESEIGWLKQALQMRRMACRAQGS